MQNMTMGQRIAERRKMLGLSQEALGERVGVSRQAICKWEADGAIPEIDKLIALSRLFEVSVGWLLGVEEQQKSGALTEEQIKTMEELIRRYHPAQEPQPARKGPAWLAAVGEFFRSHAWLPLAVALTALVLAVTTTVRIHDSLAYINGLLNQFTYSYDQMNRDIEYISGQVESLAQGEKPLTEFDLSALALEDLSGAKLTFTAVPKSWGPQDTGVITARLEGREVARGECAWDGTVLRGELELTAADGYEYFFLLTRSDGTQEQQNLTPDIADQSVVQLAEGLRFACEFHYDGGTGRTTGSEFWSLHFTGFNAGIGLPPLLADREDLTLGSVEVVLYRSGSEIARYPAQINANSPVTVYYPDGTAWTAVDHAADVWLDEALMLEDLTGEDWVEAVLELTLSNGVTCRETVHIWDVSDAP